MKITVPATIIKKSKKLIEYNRDDLFEYVVKEIRIFTYYTTIILDLYEQSSESPHSLTKLYSIDISEHVDRERIIGVVEHCRPSTVLKEFPEIFGSCKFLKRANIVIYE